MLPIATQPVEVHWSVKTGGKVSGHELRGRVPSPLRLFFPVWWRIKTRMGQRMCLANRSNGVSRISRRRSDEGLASSLQHRPIPATA